MQLSACGTVRVGPITAIPDVLATLGFSLEDVMSAAGMDPEIFDDPDKLISFKSRVHLLNICRNLTDCEHFGLLVGQQASLPAFGIIGYLVLNSPDVKTALQGLVHHLHLHAQGSLVVSEDDGDIAFLGYSIYEENIEASGQLVDAAVAIAHNFMRDLCGEDWQATEVCFSHARPRTLKPYRRHFNTALRFNAECNGVYFPSRWLDRPVTVADPELYRLLKKQVDALELRYREDFPEQVRRVLHNAILTGRATADDIAPLLSVHSRTLHRRLRTHGTSFQELADECRFSIAKQMLECSNMELLLIAEMLGYSDTRAFQRAFKRWSGITPTSWRQS